MHQPYQQARTMGRFVWVDRVLAPADTASNGLMMPTTKTTTESYTYILNDLDAAIPDLPASVKSGELSRNMAYIRLQLRIVPKFPNPPSPLYRSIVSRTNPMPPLEWTALEVRSSQVV